MQKISDPLVTYKAKRDFSVSPEPAENAAINNSHRSFVVQKHAARSNHYDFRLELDGTLKSWAVPKGPSLDPAQKRLAVRVEDHPLSYADFEGVIPPKQYGAGTVMVWDRGTWEPLEDPRAGLEAGLLKFRLKGMKLSGTWALVQIKGKPGEKQESWLLIKERDAYARSETEFKVVESMPESVLNDAEGPTIPSGAIPEAIPATLAPQLATLVENIPLSGDWSYEIKFDGYRILARIDNGEVALFTRNGHNWTDKLKNISLAVRDLKIASGWLDGEIVVLGADGMPDFGALQNAFESSGNVIRYFIFDIPFYNGFDLRRVGLAERRDLLAKIIPESSSGTISFSQDFVGSADDILLSACELGLEGIIGKRRDSPYVSARSPNWIKLKCIKRQEFVVVGYTESKGQREIGALLLGVYDNAGHLKYAGKVGTGFDSLTAKMLKEKLSVLATDQMPLHSKPRDVQGNWVVPKLVAEVSFAEWTKDGRLRHSVYRGLRADKPASLIIRETALGKTLISEENQKISQVEDQSLSPEDIGSQISNPDRVIDPSTGLTKLDIVKHYQLVSKWILPHLTGRPASFLRAPSGISGQLFFQKHGGALNIPELKRLDPSIDPGHPALMEIGSPVALIGAVQMNVIEFHTWNARAKNIEKPDRMIFDLDPGEGVEWIMMLESAELTRALLEELGLQSFLKTSGGKGLHIVVPLLTRDSWETVKEFSKAVSQHLAKVIPSQFVALSGPRNRVGKVFVDYIRNSRGATTVAAYSVRARPGLGVSVPCSWQELSGLTGGAHWTISNVRQRLESSENPWKEYTKTKQSLKTASKRILN
jgi:bifunctional non-homologous end joining protein LigD